MRPPTWARLAAFSVLALGLWTCSTGGQMEKSAACDDITVAVNDFNAAFSSYPANSTTALAKMDAGIAELSSAINAAESTDATDLRVDLENAKTVAQGVRNAIANNQTPNWTGLNIATNALGNDCSQILGGVTTP